MMMMINDIKELLTRAILGSAHKLRKVLYESTKCLSWGNSSTCKKGTLVQAWGGREHSRRLRIPEFKTVGT
jgi:hypothetical protein